MKGFRTTLLAGACLAGLNGGQQTFAAEDDLVVDEKAMVAPIPAPTLAVRGGVVVRQVDGPVRIVHRIQVVQEPAVVNQLNGVNEPKPVRMVNRVVVQRPELVDWAQVRDQQLDNSFRAAMETAIDQLDRVCELTLVQRQKLRKAAFVDQRNYLQQINETQPAQVNRDGFLLNGAVMRRSPSVVPANILGPSSFFGKMSSSMLTDQQRNLLRESQRSRRSVHMALSDIKRVVQLDATQETAVTEFLIRAAGQFVMFEADNTIQANSERLALLYLLSVHSEQQLKPILSSTQWKQAQPALGKFRNHKPSILNNFDIDSFK